MKKNSFYRNINNITYAEIIYDILEGNLTNREILHERIKSVNIKFPQSYLYLYLIFQNTVPRADTRVTLQMRLILYFH